MLSSQAIRHDVAPKDGHFGFIISELEALLPAGIVDHTAQRVYEEVCGISYQNHLKKKCLNLCIYAE